MTLTGLEAAWCVTLRQPASDFWNSTPARVEAFFEVARADRAAEDARAGVIAAVIANQNRRAGTTAFQPHDFFPGLKRPAAREADPSVMLGRVKSFFNI